METPTALAEILTVDDLEREYRIPKGTQKSLRARRQIPFLQLGGGRMIRYRRADIIRWMEERVVPVLRVLDGGAR